MSSVVRFTVSIEEDLLEKFDRFCEEGQYPTRSEAIRKLLHEKLTAQAWSDDKQPAAATLTLVYDHHHSNLTDRLLDIQHEHGELIVSTMHVHLDHHHCLEVIVLRGKAKEIRELAAKLRGLKGVQCGEMVVATSGQSHD